MLVPLNLPSSSAYHPHSHFLHHTFLQFWLSLGPYEQILSVSPSITPPVLLLALSFSPIHSKSYCRRVIYNLRSSFSPSLLPCHSLSTFLSLPISPFLLPEHPFALHIIFSSSRHLSAVSQLSSRVPWWVHPGLKDLSRFWLIYHQFYLSEESV